MTSRKPLLSLTTIPFDPRVSSVGSEHNAPRALGMSSLVSTVFVDRMHWANGQR
jgi:hypothetical protein